MSANRKDIQSDSGERNKASSYRNILKTTSLYSGVEVYKIIIGVVRSKMIAILLGPSGMGIMHLFQSGTDLIKYVTSLGLSQSAVRDVADANSTGDAKRIGTTMAIVKKLVFFTGLLGMLLVITLSPILSKSSFGNYNYVFSFIFLSIILLFDQISEGQKVILRGTRSLKLLAKASVIGLTVGLLVSTPLYYFFGVKGIVPASIISSIASVLISYRYSSKVSYDRVKVTLREMFKGSRVMIKMGIALNLSTLLGALSTYLIRAFISVTSGTEMVGFYSVGVTITTIYVGMIYTSMNADFYPRLVALSSDREQSNSFVSQQGEIGSLILGPAIVACIIFMPLIITILYSKEFVMTSNYVTFAIIGMMFRLVGWLASINFVAHGDARQFAINETIANIYFFALNIVGFKLGGLTGSGISFSLAYSIYFIHIYSIAKKKYKLSFSPMFVRLYGIQVTFILIGLGIAFFFTDWLRYLIGGVYFIFVGGYSLIELNRKTKIFIKKNEKKI